MSATALTLSQVQGVIDDGVLHGRPSRVRIDRAVVHIPQAAAAALIPAGSPARLERLVGGSALIRVSLSLTDVVAEVRLSATPGGRLAAELVAVRTDLIGVPVSLVAAALREFIPAQPWLTAGPGPRWEVDLAALGGDFGLSLPPVSEVRGEAGVLELELRRDPRSIGAEQTMSEEKIAKPDEPLEAEKPAPQVSISLPESLEITTAPAAGDPPLEVTLQLTNPGPGVLHLRLKPEPDWVTVDKPAIAIQAGETGEVKVSVEPASVTAENRSRARLKAEWAVEEGGAGIGSGNIRIVIPSPRRLLLCPNPACGELIHSGDVTCGHCGTALQFCPECGSAAARTAARCSAREPHTLPPLPAWPVMEGDSARTGGLAELSSNTLKTLWTFAFDQPATVTGPVVAWDTVFIAGGGPPRLMALDLTTGQKLWERTLPENTSLSALSAPGISGERVVIADGSGEVLAVEGASGKEAWTSRLPFPTPGGCLAAGSGLFIPTAPPEGEGGHVVALWPADGAKVWSARLPAGSALPLAARRGHVVAHGVDGTLRSLNAKDGSLAWERPLGPPKFGAVAAESLILAGLETELVALDADSGEERWRFAAGSPITAGPATNGNRVYVSAGSTLHVLDANSGAKLQELTLPGEQSSKPTPTPAGALLVSGDALYQCSATEPTCIEVAQIAQPTAGPIAFAGGKLLVLTTSGVLALGASVDPV